MSRKCECCKHGMTGSKCPICGYMHVVFLDESGAEEEKQRLDAHKREVVKRFTGFSTMAYVYQWNAEKSALEEKAKETIFIADGEVCFGKIIWSEKGFGQNPKEEPSERKLKIYYKVNDMVKELEVFVKTIQCNDFWHLGIQIHEDFTCSVYLGTKDNYTTAGPYALEWQ